MKDEIILDLYYYTIQFCIDNDFSKEQISAFFSIIKRTHAICVETPFGNVENTLRYFRDMLLCHAVKVSYEYWFYLGQISQKTLTMLVGVVNTTRCVVCGFATPTNKHSQSFLTGKKFSD